jgi:hypothetical protein
MAIERRDLVRYGGIGLLAIVTAAAVAWGAWRLGGGGAGPVDSALEEVRRLPLIGPVMADNPAAESRMRAAIEEEMRNPTPSGPSRPFSLVTELRQQYVVPSLRGADDASALAALAARADFARYLRGADPAACRQFGLGALLRPDLLDAEGRRLFDVVLGTLEAAWRHGKVAGRPQPVATREEIAAMLPQAGFTPADFDRLKAVQTLSNEASCDLELKLDSAAPLLPVDRRGAFARAILSN